MLSCALLGQRARLIQAIRSFFIDQGYLEVDTPLRLPVQVPEANIVPLTSEGAFLHTSPEMCMKRLLARGNAHIFQICHCFRKEECGRLHHPEFTMLEWYQRDSDYRDLMVECEQLLTALIHRCRDFPGLDEDGRLRRPAGRVDLTPPWDRLRVDEAFLRYAGIDVHAALAAGRFDEILVTVIEPQLGLYRPVFLYDYPLELGALARPRLDDPAVAERFELYIAGIELANAFSELVDPEEQRYRFLQEIEKIQQAGRWAAMPEKLLEELGQITSAAGIALGVDRLLMLLTGSVHLASVIPFADEEF